MKIERALLIDAVAKVARDRLIAGAIALQLQIRQRAVYLVCRGEYEGRRSISAPNLLKQIECAADVDFEVVNGVGQAGGDRHLRGEMENLLGVANRGPQGFPIPDVGY